MSDWTACPECGHPLPVDPAMCECGHSKATHHLTATKNVTYCLRFGPKGKCPCESYQLREVTGVSEP